MHRLLQLSDIHFGADHAFAQEGRPPTARNLRAAVMQALRDNDCPVEFDVLIVSGDVFTHRDPIERTEARLQLRALAEDLRVGQTVLVPGNHDVDWDADPSDRFYDYAQLVSDLGALGAPDRFPVVHVLDAVDGKPLALVALDSCQLESKAQSGLGLVGDHQLDALDARLAAASVTPGTHTMVAVLHHHLLPVATVPVPPATANPADSVRLVVSVTVDTMTVLGRLAELGFVLVLHGHQHAPVIMQFGACGGDAGPCTSPPPGRSACARAMYGASSSCGRSVTTPSTSPRCATATTSPVASSATRRTATRCVSLARPPNQPRRHEDHACFARGSAVSPGLSPNPRVLGDAWHLGNPTVRVAREPPPPGYAETRRLPPSRRSARTTPRRCRLTRKRFTPGRPGDVMSRRISAVRP